MSYAILRTAKLKSFGEIGGSLSHNYRTRKTINADQTRTHQNTHSLSSGDLVMEGIKARLPEKVRSNGVLAIEYLITASPEWDGWGTAQENTFFEKSLDFLKAKHGAENIVSTTIHRDESTPHLVAYVVPIDQRGKLNCRAFLGGKAKLSALQTDFAATVADLGLQRGLEGSKAEHKTIKQFYGQVQKAVTAPEVVRPDPPSAKLLETTKQYGEKVANAVFTELKPRLDQLGAVTQEVKILKKEKAALRKALHDAAPYLHAIRPLVKEDRARLDDLVKAESLKLQAAREKEKQAEADFKARFKGFDDLNSHEKDRLYDALMELGLTVKDPAAHQKKYEKEYGLVTDWRQEKAAHEEAAKRREKEEKEWQAGYERHLAAERQRELEEKRHIEALRQKQAADVAEHLREMEKVNRDLEQRRSASAPSPAPVRRRDDGFDFSP